MCAQLSFSARARPASPPRPHVWVEQQVRDGAGHGHVIGGVDEDHLPMLGAQRRGGRTHLLSLAHVTRVVGHRERLQLARGLTAATAALALSRPSRRSSRAS